MKRHVRQSKYDPLVEEVEILEVNPNTSHVRTLHGKEMTVSNKHLAPIGSSSSGTRQVSDTLSSPDTRSYQADVPDNHPSISPDAETELQEDHIESESIVSDTDTHDDSADNDAESVSDIGEVNDFVRRSSRKSKQTQFYGYNN